MITGQSIIDSNVFLLYSTGNLSLDTFNIIQRIFTDVGFRCVDEAIAYTGFHSGGIQVGVLVASTEPTADTTRTSDRADRGSRCRARPGRQCRWIN